MFNLKDDFEKKCQNVKKKYLTKKAAEVSLI